MLYVFVGNDVVAVRTEAHEFLSAQESDAVHVTSENYAPGMFLDYVNAQSLFGGVPEPVVLDFLSEYEGALETLDEYLPDIAASGRAFVLIDTKPRMAREKLLRSHAVHYEEIEEREEKEKFNTFALADALARKDKKSLWVLLMRARMAGVEAEAIAGVLFWQLKSLRLAAQTASSAEAGMKDYPYKKAKGALKMFKKGEVEELSESLLTLYHKGHADSDMDVSLERFVLTL